MSARRHCGYVCELVVVVVAFAIVGGCFKLGSVALELAAYRRHCATPVTLWDAMFLELSIDACKTPG